MASERDQLIRDHFEAYRDLTYMEESEPKLLQKGMNAEQLQFFHNGWLEYAELMDWPVWKKGAAILSDEQLKDDTMQAADRKERLEYLRWHREEQGDDYQQKRENLILRKLRA